MERTKEAKLVPFLQWLEERHAQVMDAEGRALACLNGGDKEGYNTLMRTKARLLAAMTEDAKPLLASLPGEVRFTYLSTLEAFSGSARTALSLDSTFYMSALLYPDDHQPGQPDNLALCLERMRAQQLDFH